MLSIHLQPAVETRRVVRHQQAAWASYLPCLTRSTRRHPPSIFHSFPVYQIRVKLKLALHLSISTRFCNSITLWQDGHPCGPVHSASVFAWRIHPGWIGGLCRLPTASISEVCSAASRTANELPSRHDRRCLESELSHQNRPRYNYSRIQIQGRHNRGDRLKGNSWKLDRFANSQEGHWD